MGTVDLPDFQKGVFFFDGSVPWMTSADFPDWTDGINVVDQSISPTQDFPDWTKVVGTVKAFPGSPPVAGMAGWWDATKVTGVADGTVPSGWTDSSGNGNNLQTFGVGNTPIFYSTTQAFLVNGLPAMWFPVEAGQPFNGMRLNLASVVSQPFSWVFVAQSGTTGTIGYSALLGSLSSGGAALQWSHASGDIAIGGGGGGGGRSGPAFDNSLHMVVGIYNGSSSAVWVDGMSVAGLNPGAVQLLTTPNQPFIGVDASHDEWGGPICEIIWYNSVLSLAQLSALRGYFQAKWGTP